MRVLVAEPGPLQQSLEVVLWAAPAGLAAHRFLRTPRGTRATWLLVGAACAVIAVDKAVDLQTVAYHAAKDWIGRYAPELRAGGSAQGWRVALLVAGGTAGLLALWALARRDRQVRTAPKLLALSGLAGVIVYLAARLVPTLGEHFTTGLRWSVELTCWALIVTGAVAGRVSRPPPR